MTNAPSADNLKAALRPVRAILEQLPQDDAHAIIARKALDTVRDEGLRSIECAPPVGAHSLPDPLEAQAARLI